MNKLEKTREMTRDCKHVPVREQNAFRSRTEAGTVTVGGMHKVPATNLQSQGTAGCGCLSPHTHTRRMATP